MSMRGCPGLKGRRVNQSSRTVGNNINSIKICETCENGVKIGEGINFVPRGRSINKGLNSRLLYKIILRKTLK